jgi:phosphohistidine phosphatase SixA
MRVLRWCLVLLSVAGAWPADVRAQPLAVFIVRHAEKADNSDDPVLSALGTQRALALAAALEDAEIGHVIVTHRQRTRLTAEPLIELRDLTPEVISFGAAGVDAHVDSIVAAIRRQNDRAVLVVGHSNTVPRIVHALGGPRMPDLCDARYAALFTVVPAHRANAAPTVAVSSFGSADPPGADSCAGMIPRD